MRKVFPKVVCCSRTAQHSTRGKFISLNYTTANTDYFLTPEYGHHLAPG